MRKKLLLALGLLALSTFSATAEAKGLMAMKVCGTSRCVAVKHIRNWWNLGASPGTTFDAPVGPYYRIELTMGERRRPVGTYTLYWLPGPGLTQGSDQSGFDPWMRLTRGQRKPLEAASAGLQPITPTLSRVAVGGHEVANPDSYLDLFGHRRTSYLFPPNGSKWTTIDVTPAHPNPWLRSHVTLRYQPQRRLLERPGYPQVVLPPVWSRLLADRPEGNHTALVAGISVAGLALACVAAVGRRTHTNRRRRP
jgi:hypothetical protein